MATLQLFKVTALPQTLQPNALYWVLNGNYVEEYLTSKTGVAKMTGNTQMIKDVAQPLIDAALNAAAASTVIIVDNIAARNALTKKDGMEVMVLDATGDSTVKAGTATYVYRASNTTWYKISEAESMDVVLRWANIIDGPTSTPTQIDGAVAASHTHGNKAVLDLLDQNADGLTFNGSNVSSTLKANDW